MVNQATRTQEMRVRRMAQRQGLRLEKSTRRDPLALEYGTYRLVDAETSEIVYASRHGYGLALDTIEAALRTGDL